MKFSVITLRAAERDCEGILAYLSARSKPGRRHDTFGILRTFSISSKVDQKNKC